MKRHEFLPKAFGNIRSCSIRPRGRVLVDERSWISLHEHFGTKERAAGNMAAYKDRETGYKELMRRDIAMWSKAHADEIDSVLSKFTLAEGAKETVNGLKKKGYTVAIISAGIDILAKKAAKEPDIQYVPANGLEFDVSGRLTGEGVERVALGRKEYALESLAKYLELEPKQCVAVGNSERDASFLAASGLGVAYGREGADKPNKVAKLKIENLRELLEYL